MAGPRSWAVGGGAGRLAGGASADGDPVEGTGAGEGEPAIVGGSAGLGGFAGGASDVTSLGVWVAGRSGSGAGADPAEGSTVTL
jgi:hypothetical protein